MNTDHPGFNPVAQRSTGARSWTAAPSRPSVIFWTSPRIASRCRCKRWRIATKRKRFQFLVAPSFILRLGSGLGRGNNQEIYHYWGSYFETGWSLPYLSVSLREVCFPVVSLCRHPQAGTLAKDPLFGIFRGPVAWGPFAFPLRLFTPHPTPAALKPETGCSPAGRRVHLQPLRDGRHVFRPNRLSEGVCSVLLSDQLAALLSPFRVRWREDGGGEEHAVFLNLF